MLASTIQWWPKVSPRERRVKACRRANHHTKRVQRIQGNIGDAGVDPWNQKLSRAIFEVRATNLSPFSRKNWIIVYNFQVSVFFLHDISLWMLRCIMTESKPYSCYLTDYIQKTVSTNEAWWFSHSSIFTRTVSAFCLSLWFTGIYLHIPLC